MRIARTMVVAGLVVSPAGALAQHTVHTKAAASGRVAGIAPAPVISAPGPFLTGSVPIIVSPDGRVFANFGGGFEQVVTACGMSNGIVVTQSAGLVQPTVVQPTVSQPGIVAGPLPFTPAVPNQQTASQQMLGQAAAPVQGQQQIVVGNRACWSTDGRGQVFVGRQ